MTDLPPPPWPVDQPGIPSGWSLGRRVQAHLDLLPVLPRSPGYHPSAIGRMCPVLEFFGQEAADDAASDDPTRIAAGLAFWRASLAAGAPPGRLQLEFGVGTDIHVAVQYRLGQIGLLWGRWACGGCGADVPGAGLMPRTQVPDVAGRPFADAAPCRACAGQNRRAPYPWRYREPDVGATALAQAFGIAGHADGVLAIPGAPASVPGGSWRYVLEIKSINEAGFSGKMGTLPKPEHIQQASLYGWLLGISHIYFLYVCKNQVSQWHEIVVPVDRAAIASARDRIVAVRQARASGQPPLQARVCGDVREERARTCPAVGRCFGQQRPVNFWEHA